MVCEWLEGTRGFGYPWLVKAKVGGSVKLCINMLYLGTALNLISMEDNENSIAICWQEQPPLKTSFISLLQMKSSSTWLIPASLCEGPFFYFYAESPSFSLSTLLKAQLSFLV